MKPVKHAKASLVVGLLGWWWSGSGETLPLSLAAGTLIDLDHLVDYAWYTLTRDHRLILPLHGYELAFPLWRLVKMALGQRTATVVTASYVLHLLSDRLENRTKPGTCWLVWRLINSFRIDDLSRDPEAGLQGRQEDLETLQQMIFGANT